LLGTTHKTVRRAVERQQAGGPWSRRPRPISKKTDRLFFRFIAAAYERRSLGIASHWAFDQWGHFLPDEMTAVSMIDRLLHHAVVVVTKGESFRMKEAKTRGGGPPKRTG
jgi:hypothetical protein